MKIRVQQANESFQPKADSGFVIPAVLWWMGVPFSLLLILWFLGMV